MTPPVSAPDAISPMAELKALWIDQAGADLERAAVLIDLLADPATVSAESSESLFRIFHDMAGQAGVFGYPLMASVAKKFCAYWRPVKATPGAHDLSVARSHLVAARFILDRRLEGCADPAGAAIMAKLDSIVATNG